MESITITPKNKEQRTQILNFLKSLDIAVEAEKDDTKMTKEAFFAMIDQARKQPARRISRKEMKKMLLG